MSTWTATQIEIFEALTLKSKVFIDEQLARGWNLSHVEKVMAPLCEVGLADHRQVFAHPLLEMNPPAFQWDPGDRSPAAEEFRALAEYFQSRWTQPEQLFDVYVATRRAANLMGSYAIDPPERDQWTHDVHIAEIYINLRATNPPEVVSHIVGEGALPKLGKEIKQMKDPDLFLLDDNRQAQIVFEFAGAYDETHVRELYLHCSGEAHRKLKRRFPGRKHYLYPSPRGTQFFLF